MNCGVGGCLACIAECVGARAGEFELVLDGDGWVLDFLVCFSVLDFFVLLSG